MQSIQISVCGCVCSCVCVSSEVLLLLVSQLSDPEVDCYMSKRPKRVTAATRRVQPKAQPDPVEDNSWLCTEDVGVSLCT